jgi:hypothetical protein
MRRLVSAAGLLLVAGCGYVGDPQPPALNIPERIGNLRGVQRAGAILVSFTPSFMSTERLVLKRLAEIDLRIGAIEKGREFDLNEWASSATRVPAPEPKGEETEVRIPADTWRGREVVIAVRALGPTGRAAAWSNLVTMQVVEPLSPPPAVDAEPAPDGIRLRWRAETTPVGAQWRVWRFREGGTETALLGKTDRPAFTDGAVQYGARYTYAVQTVLQAGPIEAESEISRTVTVSHEDVFPPPAPTGLTALGGVNAVELSWDRSPDSGVKGYQVWRAEDGGGFARHGELAAGPSFSDSKIVSRRKYRYAVTAVDEKGNESPPSEPVEIAAP